MRARFVYEKFTEESDPVKDMGIGAVKVTKIYHMIMSPNWRNLDNKRIEYLGEDTIDDILKNFDTYLNFDIFFVIDGKPVKAQKFKGKHIIYKNKMYKVKG